MNKVCFELTNMAFPIRLVKTGKNKFRVEYGLQIDHGDYPEAAALLGQAIMHALTCDSKLD